MPMNEIMRRRRALMVERPWEDTGFDLSGVTDGSSCAHVYDSNAKTLRIYSTSTGTFRHIYKNFTYDTNYEYLVEYDVLIQSGTHCFAFADGNSLATPNTHGITSSGHVRLLTGTLSRPVYNINMYCTFTTSQNGNCTISNFSIKRRLKK